MFINFNVMCGILSFVKLLSVTYLEQSDFSAKC